MCICMYLYMCLFACIYMHMYKYMHDLCTHARCGRISEPQHRHTTAYVNECIPLFSCHVIYFVHSTYYILCTACRILAHRVMFFVLHTTRNKSYLVLSCRILSYLMCVAYVSATFFYTISHKTCWTLIARISMGRTLLYWKFCLVIA